MSCRSSAERTSHFTYGKQCGIELHGGRSIFFLNLLKEESHNGHASAQSLQPRVPASCPCDKLLTAVAISWLENGECRVITPRISSRAAAGKGFVSGTQAFPAQLSQQLPNWENRGSEKRVPPSASTGPARGCCSQVWESRCVLRWALGWNAGSRSRVHLLPVNRLLAPSICSRSRTLKLRLRKGLRASHLTDGGKLAFSLFWKLSIKITWSQNLTWHFYIGCCDLKLRRKHTHYFHKIIFMIQS